MSTFNYTAKSQPGKTIQGQIEADSKQEAVNKVAKMGLFPVTLEMEETRLEREGAARFQRISRRDVILFTGQLSTLIEGGVNIINSLQMIYDQIPSKALKSVLKDIIKKIKDGKSLSESFSAYPQAFSSLYISMLHSGEVGGNIDATLKRLAEFLENEEEFRNSVKAALVYPLFIFVVSIATIFVLLGFVIPRLATMFEDMGQNLPLPTKILLYLSKHISNSWWFVLAALFILIFAIRRVYATPHGRVSIDRFKLRLPMGGELILKTEIGRLFRTLSLLLSNGIPVLSALNVSGALVENQVLKSELFKIKDQIAGGVSLSKSMRESKLFPALTVNIISVGEESGTLEKSLLRIADEYERSVDRSLKAFIRLLEPTIILIMGLVVGFIVLSMLLPIFQINLIVS